MAAASTSSLMEPDRWAFVAVCSPRIMPTRAVASALMHKPGYRIVYSPGNSADYGGAGVHADAFLSATGCVFTANEAITGAGLDAGKAEVVSSTFAANRADACGAIDADGTFVNCLVSGNVSSSSGGGICSGDATFINCAITDNHADLRGGGHRRQATFVDQQRYLGQYR